MSLRRTPPRSEARGAHGEDLAVRHLQASGIEVLARNVRTRLAQIDLLCREGHTLVVVEVKTRSQHPAPERCLGPAQRQRLQRAGAALARVLAWRPQAVRIDVIAVRWSAEAAEVRWFRGSAKS